MVVRLKNVFTTTSKDFLTQQNKTVATKGPWDIIIYFTLKIKQIKNNVQRQIGLVYILNLNIVKLREREGQRVGLGRSLKGHL